MDYRREIFEVFKQGTYRPLGPIGVRYLPTDRQTRPDFVAVGVRPSFTDRMYASVAM